MAFKHISRLKRLLVASETQARLLSASCPLNKDVGPRRGRPFASLAEQYKQEPAKYDAETKRKILVNRLMYRSKQRGFLEMDLLLGQWAERNVPEASEPLLAAFEGLLDLENPDLFKWLTGQEKPPAELESNLAFQEVRKDIGSQLRGTVQAAAQTKSGKAWLRGWDDWKKEVQESSQTAKE